LQNDWPPCFAGAVHCGEINDSMWTNILSEFRDRELWFKFVQESVSQPLAGSEFPVLCSRTQDKAETEPLTIFVVTLNTTISSLILI
jgi:hypothetical protein